MFPAFYLHILSVYIHLSRDNRCFFFFAHYKSRLNWWSRQSCLSGEALNAKVFKGMFSDRGMIRIPSLPYASVLDVAFGHSLLILGDVWFAALSFEQGVPHGPVLRALFLSACSLWATLCCSRKSADGTQIRLSLETIVHSVVSLLKQNCDIVTVSLYSFVQVTYKKEQSLLCLFWITAKS